MVIVHLVKWVILWQKKANELGANVTLVIGPTNLSMDLSNIESIRVQDSEEMFNETIKYFDNSDVIICSAAISDFKQLK